MSANILSKKASEISSYLIRSYSLLKEGALRKFLSKERATYASAHERGKWIIYPDKTESFFWEGPDGKERRIFSILGELGCWEIKWHE